MAFLAGLSGGASPMAMLSIAALLLAACVLPTAFTVLLFRTGRASTLDLRERTDRLIPSALTATGSAVAWVALSLSDAPRHITYLAIGVCVQMVLLALLTTRWKVSYHAASACALVVVSRLVGSPGLTVVLIILAACIGWARVYQGRHSFAQVAVGALTSLPVAWVTTP